MKSYSSLPLSIISNSNFKQHHNIRCNFVYQLIFFNSFSTRSIYLFVIRRTPPWLIIGMRTLQCIFPEFSFLSLNCAYSILTWLRSMSPICAVGRCFLHVYKETSLREFMLYRDNISILAFCIFLTLVVSFMKITHCLSQFYCTFEEYWNSNKGHCPSIERRGSGW